MRARIALLLALLVLVRGAAVLALGDVFVYAEELEKGAAAVALGAGLDVEHHRLAYHYYEGGGFVTSHLNAAWFALVGPSLLAHKLNALLFAAAILAVGAAFAERRFGPAGAWTFGLLFVFAPESFQKLSLLNLGIHFQALLFVALVVALAARVLFDAPAPRRAWLGLGLAAGFGTYFSYQVALPAAAAAAVLLAARLRGALRPAAGDLGALAAGLALGAAPLGCMAALVGAEVLDVHGHGGLLRPPGEQLATLAEFLRSIWADRGPAGSAAVALFPLAALAACAAAARGGDRARGPHAWVVAALAAVAAAYAATSFAVGEVYHWVLFQRLSLVWFLATLAIAAAAGRALASGSPALRRVAAVAVGLLVLAGARGSVAIVAQGQPGTPAANARLLAATRGTAWEQYVGKLRGHVELGPEALLRELAAVEADPAVLFPQLATHGLEGVPLDEAVAIARRVGGADWRELVRGLGWSLLARHGFDPAAALEEAAAAEPAELRPLLAEALGRVGRGGHATVEGLADEVALGERLGAPEAWFVGLGHRLLQVKGDQRPRGYFRRTLPVFLVHPEGAEAWLAESPPARRAALERGYRRSRELSRLGAR